MATTFTQRAQAAVEELQANPIRFTDRVFFLLGTVGSAWLAFLLIHQLVTAGWRHVWAFIPFWLIVTYLVLPRIHSVLSRVYLPDYFIGRARTREGLLGDPVNLGLLGTQEQLHAAMLRAGWHRADELNLVTGWRIVRSTLRRLTYPDAPVSPLFLFGARHAFTYQQEVEGNPAKRHHVRFWPTPDGWLLPGGRRVDWLAAGTYDRAVGLSHFTGQVTHRIAEDVDFERDHILETLAHDSAANTGMTVEVLHNFSTGYHHRNGGGDRIHTDGDLPIIDLRELTEPEPEISEEIHADESAAAQRRLVPLTVAFGVLIMLVRVITGAISLSRLLALGPAALLALPLVDPVARAMGIGESQVHVVIGTVLAAFLVLYLVLAGFIYAGYGWARTAALAMSTVSTLMWTVLWFVDVSDRTIALNVMGNGAEILVLLALSGDTVRLYVVRRRHEREQVRAAVRLSS